jgi:hypothetical protein
MVVSGNRHDLGVRDCHLGLKHRQLAVLLVFLRSKVPPRKRQDHRVAALEFAQLANGLRVVREFVVRENATRDNV